MNYDHQEKKDKEALAVTDWNALGKEVQELSARHGKYDFYLGKGNTERGDSGASRALVKYKTENDKPALVINFENDFSRGTLIDSILRVSGDVEVGTTETPKNLIVTKNIYQTGLEFILGKGSATGGDSGVSRALVKEQRDSSSSDSSLILNYNGDFKGGTFIDSNLKVKGDICQTGYDFLLGKGGSGDLRGNSGLSRALVKYKRADKPALIINFANDFSGGTFIESDLKISGGVEVGTTTVPKNLKVNGDVEATKFIGDGSGLTNLSLTNINETGIKINNETPIVFKRYTEGDNVKKSTEYSSNDYNAAIVGYAIFNADIQESGSGELLQVYMYIENNKWHIRADLRSHNTYEKWHVDVMFVRKEISTRNGYKLGIQTQP